MESDKAIIEMMEDTRIKNLGLKQELIEKILSIYSEKAIDILLENGYIILGNGLIIEIAQLTDRVHVLRGISYKSTRKYKLKLSMDESVYTIIENYYDNLGRDIL